MAASEKLTTKDLLYPVRNAFYSKVDADSLISAMDRNQLLRKREMKLLERVDEMAKKTLLFDKLYSADQLSAESLVKLFVETENEQNVQFSEVLQSILSSIQKSAKLATTSVVATIPEVPKQLWATASLPPLKHHCPLDDNLSTIFSSAGGVLYSPVYGVTVYIPAGAILGEGQVEVSFRLLTEEADIQTLLSHPLFAVEGSVLCSGIFEFEAKSVNTPGGKKFGKFHSDVWIELPHCLSFGGCSLKDYSTTFVMSERRGKVEVEEQALFSESYPYVNLPVRQFCKFCMVHLPKRRFRARGCITKSQTLGSHVKKAMQNVGNSGKIGREQSASPPSGRSKQRMMESATGVSAAGKRLGYGEMNKTRSRRKALTEDKCQVHQDSSGNDSVEDAVDVNQPARVHTASNAVLQQEPLDVTSMSFMACVCQPVGRDKTDRWTAEIVFTPLLHKALKNLAKWQRQLQVQHEICAVAFHLELCLQLIRLHSKPSSIQGWRVELNTTEILLEHLTMVTELLQEDKKSSKMFTLLPRSTATVHNMGASLPLHHPVTVEGSWPTSRCYLTCQVGPRSVKSADVKPKAAQSKVVNTVESQGPAEHRSHDLTTSDPTQDAPLEPLLSTPPTIQWERDCYILALLSIMVPERHLVTLGESLGLPCLTVDQVMSGYTAGSALNVGERAYEMFRRVILSEQPLTFGKILVALNDIGRSDDLVPILRNYTKSGLMSQSFKRDSSGTTAQTECDDLPSAVFITWLHANHHTLLPCVSLPDATMDRAILSVEQRALFKDLSRRMVCVWRMVGRLLGLPDYEIEAADIEGKGSRNGECESCYQMLLKWVKHSRCPSDITYYRLMAALQLTSLGAGAALDAIFYLNGFVLNLTSARRR